MKNLLIWNREVTGLSGGQTGLSGGQTGLSGGQTGLSGDQTDLSSGCPARLNLRFATTGGQTRLTLAVYVILHWRLINPTKK